MSVSERVPMTPRGHAMLQEEFKRLKNVDRPLIVKEIEDARSHGDIAENAEYHAAKERQGLLEGRIRTLEDKLARAQIIDGTGQNSRPRQLRCHRGAGEHRIRRGGHLQNRR